MAVGRLKRLAWGAAWLAGLLCVPAAGRAESVQSGHAESVQFDTRRAEPGDALSDGVRADVAARLETWLRLVSPEGRGESGGPEGGDIGVYLSFLADAPDWPRRQVVMSRLQHAMAGAPPGDADMLRACALPGVVYAPALAACARQVGSGRNLAARARLAWVNGNDTLEDEAALLSVFGPALTPDDQWRRFERQEMQGRLEAARRQASRLDPGRQTLAEARLALRAGAPDAPALLARVPVALRDDPGLVLDRMRRLRRTGALDEACALWRSAGAAAERAGGAASLLPEALWAGAFWSERDALAHDLLLAGRDRDALAVARPTDDLAPPDRDTARFLAGWILLRRLHDPSGAEAAFRALSGARALIMRSRGLYWTGRAQADAGDMRGARASWIAAAAFPGTFYGQMAASRLAGDTASPLLFPDRSGLLLRDWLKAAETPASGLAEGGSRAEAARFADSDLVQAARLLAARHDLVHARDFLLAQDARPGGAAAHALGAALALRLGMPDVAVMIARRAGREGVALLTLGWPAPLSPPETDLPAGFLLAVIRQESGFDPAIVSPAGAYGLMQLLPAAARDVSRQARLATGPLTGASLTDPDLNMKIGSAYLARLMQKFGGSVPYVLAAYNAGPHRTDQWLDMLGDPARARPTADAMLATDAMLDWIESIPYAETRGYIQRVEENMAIYQAFAAARSGGGDSGGADSGGDDSVAADSADAGIGAGGGR
ncbi:lytic transglycosylase domain-containing protein [Nguyenibacter vanlangensis]|uniref:Lytic transglycosylase domain-containing protein n=1 Tax=Nguyenibacter vanlangensis TaxID=1216886 RepID=A0ABZ3D6F5_9PROT